jgi:hypothetical protein
VEFRRKYLDSPDLLVPAEVVGIRWVPIPERFISRSDRGIALPLSIRPPDYDQEPEPVDAITPHAAYGFSLLDLRILVDGGQTLPLAFIEAA